MIRFSIGLCLALLIPFWSVWAQQPLTWDMIVNDYMSTSESIRSAKNDFRYMHFSDSMIVVKHIDGDGNVVFTDTISYLIDERGNIVAESNSHEITWFSRNPSGSLKEKVTLGKHDLSPSPRFYSFNRNYSDSISEIYMRCGCVAEENCINDIFGIHRITFESIKNCWGLKCSVIDTIIHTRNEQNLLMTSELVVNNIVKLRWTFKYDEKNRIIDYRYFEHQPEVTTEQISETEQNRSKYDLKSATTYSYLDNSTFQIDSVFIGLAQVISKEIHSTENFTKEILKIKYFNIDGIEEDKNYEEHITYDGLGRIKESLILGSNQGHFYEYETISSKSR